MAKFEGKLKRKVDLDNGLTKMIVEFSDGVDTVTDFCIPQNEYGYLYWVSQMEESLTTSKTLKTADNVGKKVDLSPLTPKDTRTQEEKDQAKWERQYEKLKQANELVAMGVTAAEPQRDKILAKVIAGYLNSYLD